MCKFRQARKYELPEILISPQQVTKTSTFSPELKKTITLELEILKSSDYGMLDVIIATSVFIVQMTSSRALCIIKSI